LRKTRSWGIKTKIINNRHRFKRRNIHKRQNWYVLGKFKEQKGIWKEITFK
jgi:hypothetical protein